MTESVVTIRDYQDGQTILTREIMENQPLALGIEEFPATQLWSNDAGLALIKTATGKHCSVQTIDLEYLKSDETKKLTVPQFIEKFETFLHKTVGKQYFDFEVDGDLLSIDLTVSEDGIDLELDEDEGEN